MYVFIILKFAGCNPKRVNRTNKASLLFVFLHSSAHATLRWFFFDSNSAPSTGCPCADAPTAPNSQQGRSWWPYEPGDWTDMTWHFDLGTIFGMYCWRCLASSCKINGFEPRQFTYIFFWVHVLTRVGMVSTGKTRLAFFYIKFLVPPSLNQVARADAFKVELVESHKPPKPPQIGWKMALEAPCWKHMLTWMLVNIIFDLMSTWCLGWRWWLSLVSFFFFRKW